MTNKIDTVAARERLKLRREPYWHRFSKGNYLGFRRMTSGSGSWIARAMDDRVGKQIYKALGDFSDLAAHQRFDAASKAAAEWFELLGRGGNSDAKTVQDACDNYIKHLRNTNREKSVEAARRNFEKYVLDDPKFSGRPLQKLVPEDLSDWRSRLRERPLQMGSRRGQLRTDSSLNREMVPFRAALNLAYEDGFVSSDYAWRVKLRPIKNAGRRRETYLDRDQRRALIENAPEDLALFLRGLSLIPLRPGALAALTAGDYDKRLKVLKIGTDKAGADRKIPMPEATAKLLNEAIKGKLPTAHLLSQEDGNPWNKDEWKGPVKAAAAAAKLPSETTAYTLRHSVITDLVHDGLDLLTVAQISGTSVQMIEQHYGHLREKIATQALARLAL